MRIRHPFIVTFIMLLLAGAGTPAHSQGVDGENKILIRVGTGLYDVRRPNATAFRQVEIGFMHEENTLQPFAGFMSTTTEDSYGYLGLLAEVPVVNQVQALVRFAGGIYTRGTGTNLGFPLEFRSELELAWQWTSQSRIGIAFSHLSNGAFSDVNPGLEILSLTYSITR